MTDENVENYNPIYPSLEDVNAMVKLIDDSLTSDLINVSMKNADNTINGLLADNSIATFTAASEGVPSTLITAGNYLAVSDIHQAIDGTDDRATNEQAYYEKALSLINSYIQSQQGRLTASEIEYKSPYKVSQSPSIYALGIRRR